MANSSPLFVLGMPRSGTKLLMNILNKNKNIFLSDETEFLPFYLSKYGVKKFERFEDFKEIIKSIKGTSYYVRLNKEGYELKAEDAYEECTEYTIAEIFKYVVFSSTNIPRNSDQLIWGDKSPSYTKYVTLIDKYFDNAKYIHIVRDVRDCALSSKKAWNKNPYRYSQRWSDALLKLNIEKKQILRNRIIEIRYEDLCKKPEITIEKCCRFLGLEYSNLMLEVDGVENLGATKGAKGIVKENTKKYKNQMEKEFEIQIVSLALAPLLMYNYDIEIDPVKLKNKRLGKLKMGLFQVVDFINRMVFDLRNEGFYNFLFTFKRQIYHFIKSRPRN